MRNVRYLLGGFLLLSATMISCSDVKFSNAPSADCVESDCQLNHDGTETYSRLVSVQAPNKNVDILFVVDNSGTMILKQQEMANRFSGFIQSLNSKGINWRIAIATTDNEAVKSTDINNGEYREGKLVPFRNASGQSSGKYFIEKGESNAQSLFQNTIKRPETLDCINTPGNCGRLVSGDERGILTAVKQVISPNPTSFLRDSAQFHIVFISDEDERSNGGGYSGLGIEANDKPETLINYLKATGKRFKLHSIINIPSNYQSPEAFIEGGFANCVSNQIFDNTREDYEGCHYALASAHTGGVIGNIRSSSYTQILNGVGYQIEDTSLGQIDFNCVPLRVFITPVPGQPYPSSLRNPEYYENLENRYLRFSPPLAAGTQLNVQWTCRRGSI